MKLFKGEVSPDGRAVDEIDVTCAVDHANLTKCGRTAQHAHQCQLFPPLFQSSYSWPSQFFAISVCIKIMLTCRDSG